VSGKKERAWNEQLSIANITSKLEKERRKERRRND
jgi:hypothetical protein